MEFVPYLISLIKLLNTNSGIVLIVVFVVFTLLVSRAFVKKEVYANDKKKLEEWHKQKEENERETERRLLIIEETAPTREEFNKLKEVVIESHASIQGVQDGIGIMQNQLNMLIENELKGAK